MQGKFCQIVRVVLELRTSEVEDKTVIIAFPMVSADFLDRLQKLMNKKK